MLRSNALIFNCKTKRWRKLGFAIAHIINHGACLSHLKGKLIRLLC